MAAEAAWPIGCHPPALPRSIRAQRYSDFRSRRERRLGLSASVPPDRTPRSRLGARLSTNQRRFQDCLSHIVNASKPQRAAIQRVSAGPSNPRSAETQTCCRLQIGTQRLLGIRGTAQHSIVVVSARPPRVLGFPLPRPAHPIPGRTTTSTRSSMRSRPAVCTTVLRWVSSNCAEAGSLIPKTVRAFDIGYRSRIGNRLLLDLAGFQYSYGKLRTNELGVTVLRDEPSPVRLVAHHHRQRRRWKYGRYPNGRSSIVLH